MLIWENYKQIVSGQCVGVEDWRETKMTTLKGLWSFVNVSLRSSVPRLSHFHSLRAEWILGSQVHLATTGDPT